MYASDFRDLPNIRTLMNKIGGYKVFEKHRKELIKYLDKTGIPMIGEGTCRGVWDLNKSKVLKIPNATERSIFDDSSVNASDDYTDSSGNGGNDHNHNCGINLFEYLMYKRIHKKFPLAPCSLKFYKSIPLIVMDKVTVESEVDDECDWIDENQNSPLTNLNDGYQIGRTSRGRMVCFDYGYEGHIYEELVPADQYDLSEDELKEFINFPQISELRGINKNLKKSLIKALSKKAKVTIL